MLWRIDIRSKVHPTDKMHGFDLGILKLSLDEIIHRGRYHTIGAKNITVLQNLLNLIFKIFRWNFK